MLNFYWPVKARFSWREQPLDDVVLTIFK